MSILEKARELADALSNSPELADAREKEIIMNKDPEAVAIINEFQEKQRDLYMAQMQGQEPSEEQKANVEAIEQKMQENPKISAYIDAQEKFETILKSVNMIITKALSGEEESGCGGGSCGGGCC